MIEKNKKVFTLRIWLRFSIIFGFIIDTDCRNIPYSIDIHIPFVHFSLFRLPRQQTVARRFRFYNELYKKQKEEKENGNED